MSKATMFRMVFTTQRGQFGTRGRTAEEARDRMAKHLRRDGYRSIAAAVEAGEGGGREGGRRPGAYPGESGYFMTWGVVTYAPGEGA